MKVIEINAIIEMLIDLVKNMSVIIVLAYVLTRIKGFSAMLKKQALNFKQQFILILVFGAFSVYGTLSGIEMNSAIANIRDLGPAIGGLLGGPIVGLGAGLIGGIHRFTLGGLTGIPCSISTVLAGLAGGVIYYYRKSGFIRVKTAILFMALFEAFHMGLNLLIARPFDQVLVIIKSVSLPMILTNALGMGIFTFIVQNLMKEKETQKQKELIESELTVAREIQMSIVPKIFPAFPERPEFDIFAVLRPAKEVGGDLYDFFLLDEDHLCFTIGDVSGKGVPASLFMAVTKTLIKAKADIRLKPDEILAAVNSELCEDNDSMMFVTEFLGILTISTGDIVYSNGGHNMPYVLRKNGSVAMLPRLPGMALGVMEDISYCSGSIKLDPGDSLILYTDGVTEAMNESGQLFGDPRMEEALTGVIEKTAEEEVALILKTTCQFADGAQQSDDITIVVLKVLGN